MKQPSLRIGILNLMHDKVDTQERFSKVLQNGPYEVEVDFFYPRSHYTGRQVPDLVQQISQPLDLRKVTEYDAFIITGAPVEQLPFAEITYLEEVHRLIDRLVEQEIPQLYICWGAMAAADYLYGMPKRLLPEKLFGIFPNFRRNPDPLLAGLPDGFLAPHARYAELDIARVAADPRLVINAVTESQRLFSFRARGQMQYFLFSHLEYGRDALLKEYRRERNAHPDTQYSKPQNYFRDPLHMKGPEFSWERTQRTFFDNWLRSVAEQMTVNQLVKE
ncbi:homoserine O-acetyltransferase/O-succinyltransferase family protein [Limosilactobacillus oris]|uniref:homoserine O-acetyltransferase/O-succinyltransferase family protein n=1 Tax=Limosilactobacillus oris TaxID=1632 RepID=UPI002235DB66|nr:homoserine O-succinyltransferase [Limosilactobacillus oris]MCW4388472.1 homoserine O-succinyltransferase [Limosilactobacillus oris]